ncbi:MAG TPA: hypothetical protein VJ717_15450 [Gemmatimonadaceae bacterium]|nr:hypothetical protein [Gemmatimonadaceae bacterium]
MLSDRAYYMVFYSGYSENATPELLIVLRGAPGWMQMGNRATGRSSLAAPGSGRPWSSSITIGNVHFECSFRPNEQILRIGATDYPLGGANVVVVDRVDAVGGQPKILPPFKVPLPRTSRESLAAVIARLPELQQYIH